MYKRQGIAVLVKENMSFGKILLGMKLYQMEENVFVQRGMKLKNY